MAMSVRSGADMSAMKTSGLIAAVGGITGTTLTLSLTPILTLTPALALPLTLTLALALTLTSCAYLVDPDPHLLCLLDGHVIYMMIICLAQVPLASLFRLLW